MPTRLRLSCRALLITVLVRSNSIQPWAPCLPPAKSGPDSALTRLTDNSKRNRRLKIYITCKDKQMTSRTFSGDYSQEFVIYTVSQKSEPPKQFATATANLHRFKWNFTHTRLHLVLSSTSNFIRIPYSVYEMFNSFKLLSQISVTDTTSSLPPLPDPWHRPSERTIDWRVASFWSEHYWQSSESVAWSTA